MSGQFEVNLGAVSERKVDASNLSQAARTLWGFDEKEGEVTAETKAGVHVVGGTAVEAQVVPVTPTKECCEDERYNMVVDSPKELWDVVGHLNLSFHVDSWKDVQERVEGCAELWDSIRETYADRIAAMAEEATKVSPSQVAFVQQLCSELGETTLDVTAMTKGEASAVIETLIAKRDARKPQPTAPAERAPYIATAQTTRAPSGGFARGGGTKPMSDKQAKLIQDLCGRGNMNLPDGFDTFTSTQASAFIQSRISR